MTHTAPEPPSGDSPAAPAPPTAQTAAATGAARLGVDWWAVIVAGVFVTLALLDVLPKIPW